MKLYYLFIFLFLFQNGVFAIRYPVTPTSPVIADENSKKNPEAAKKNIPKNRISISAYLGSGDIIDGYVEMPQMVTFQHYKNGFFYKKELNTRSIQSIEIIKYSSDKKINEKPGSKALFYKFKPSHVIIKTVDGNQFEINYLFSFCHRFLIENDDGVTWLYAIFGDEYDPKSGWKEAQNTDIHYHNTHPHAKAVKKIIFHISKGGYE